MSRSRVALLSLVALLVVLTPHAGPVPGAGGKSQPLVRNAWG